jgi:hypothetical protein
MYYGIFHVVGFFQVYDLLLTGKKGQQEKKEPPVFCKTCPLHEKVVATHRCGKCKPFVNFCEKHIEGHCEEKGEHCSVSLEEIRAQEKAERDAAQAIKDAFLAEAAKGSTCLIHKKPNQAFCYSCQVFICDMCLKEDHIGREHFLVDAVSAMHPLLPATQNFIRSARTQVDTLRKCKVDVEDAVRRNQLIYDKVSFAIDVHFQKLIDELEARRNKLRSILFKFYSLSCVFSFWFFCFSFTLDIY